MSRSVNKVILVGNVGRDPDVQTTSAGTKVAHVSLATSRRIPRDGGLEERTEWHRLTLWDRLAHRFPGARLIGCGLKEGRGHTPLT
jgi:single-strand DNA-binding protein